MDSNIHTLEMLSQQMESNIDRINRISQQADVNIHTLEKVHKMQKLGLRTQIVAIGIAVVGIIGYRSLSSKKPKNIKSIVYKVCLTGGTIISFIIIIIFFNIQSTGPCAGKSTALALLKNSLNEKGYDVYTVPETSTLLLSNGCKYPGFSDEELLLNYEFAYTRLQIEMENTFNVISTKNSLVLKKKSVIIYDRGVLDVKAYVTDSMWIEILKNLNINEDEILGRYDLVCHLKSAAIGAESFFSCETNAARTESLDEAKALDTKTFNCWNKHHNIHVIDNVLSFDLKMKKCVDLVCDNSHRFFL